MKREIVINSAFGETRAAFLEDRRLVELYVEREPRPARRREHLQGPCRERFAGDAGSIREHRP